MYETDLNVVVPAAGGTSTATVTQGITLYTQILGTSNGTAAQSFQIPQTGIEDGTITVFVASSTGNIEWTQVKLLG